MNGTRRWKKSFEVAVSSVQRRSVSLFVMGMLTGLAFPPFNLFPLLWVGFPALTWILAFHTKNKKQAFLYGWSFAFGLLVVCFHWIAGALFVDISSFWWALPFAVAGLPAALSLYYGIAALVAWKWGMKRLSGPLFLAFAWFVAEMARGHLFTGFPWDILGYVWGDTLPVLQSVSVIGIEGLTLLTICLAVFPVYLFSIWRSKKTAAFFPLIVILFISGTVWGSMRLASAPNELFEGVRFRLVQPNLDQALKWRPELRLENFTRLLDLTFSNPAEQPITHYVWPETATSYRLAQVQEARDRISVRMPKGTHLITGVVRAQEEADDTLSYFNSIIALDSKGTVTAGYDKHHLVPFGEYMPLRGLLPIPAIASMGSDFSAGPGPRTMRVGGGLAPFGALVCYEVLFPSEAVEKEDRPQFLLNVTNDAWYKGTIGPAQHFFIARTRAVEQGLSLVRVANMGVTGVVDPYGRIVAHAGQEIPNFVDSFLPKPLCNATIFTQFSDGISWLIAGILMFFCFSFRFLWEKK